MEKVLLTGGAGFIGSHIADRLIKKGYRVAIVDNLSTGKKENLNPEAKFYKADIRDQKKLSRVFAEFKPQLICHQAAHASVSESIAAPANDAEHNIIGTLNLQELALEYEVEKFVFASTGGAIYGDTDTIPTPENVPADPPSPYGLSKLCSEKYLRQAARLSQLNYLALRYGNVYGPRQDPYGEAGVVAIFCQKLVDANQPIINGDGQQTRDFVYVTDVARANVRALESDQANLAVNLGTGQETSINKIFTELKKISRSDLAEKHGPAKPGEVRRGALDISRAVDILNWKPSVPLIEGLKETYKYFAS